MTELVHGPTEGALITPDGLHRLWLFRRWAPGYRYALFVMLNPSTADASLDDPTIRRCIGFAKSWGLDGLRVVNLYAYRATKPAALWAAQADGIDIVEPGNDWWIQEFAEQTVSEDTPIVAAWGANAKPDRVKEVMSIRAMGYAKALGITTSGAPGHPLYKRADSQLMPFGGAQ